MESAEQVRARLQNIRSIEPILIALRTIALSSLRVALQRSQNANAYQAQLLQVLTLASAHLPPPDEAHAPRPCRRCALLIVGSQRGLCGPFTSTTVTAAEKALSELQAEGAEVEIMVLGEQARREARRRGLQTIWAAALPVTSVPSFQMAADLAATGLRRYDAGGLDAFYVVYNQYLAAGRYESRTVTLIPYSPPPPPEEDALWPPPIVETDAHSLYQWVKRRLTDISLYRMLLGSAAAEQSARFQLMDGASENTQRLIEELTLAQHTARQRAITEQVLELAVSAGLIRGES